MQVCPLRGSPVCTHSLLAERRSPGNDNKRGSLSAPREPPVLRRTRSLDGTGSRSVCCGCAHHGAFLVPLCYSRRGRWPVNKGEAADSSLVPESEGSAQLGTAGLLSVWVLVNPPPPPHIYFPLCFTSLLPLPSDHCPRLSSGFL